MHAHLIRDDPCQRRLSQTRRAVKQNMVQSVPSLLRRFNINLQILLRLLLANILLQGLRAETALNPQILVHHVRRNNAFFHEILP